jgi:hypothetical protein
MFLGFYNTQTRQLEKVIEQPVFNIHAQKY